MSFYLDLLEKCLLDSIYDPQPGVIEGKQIPARAHTMIGEKRLRQLREACLDAPKGDFLEAGAWRGGASIMMAGVLEYLSDEETKIWVCDSFSGLPMPDKAYPADAKDAHYTRKELAVSLEEVRENFRRYGLLDGLLDDRVKFLKGWFRDTLPGPVERLALLRIDCDMYGSTWEVLTALYSKISPGGFIIVDDYKLPACKKAVDDFRAAHNITEPIEIIDFTGIYWRKA